MDKKKLNIIVKCISAILALAAFGVLVLGVKNYARGTDMSYQVVCLGDSNLGNYRDETGVTSLLEKNINKKVLNGAFGGTTMAYIGKEKTRYSGLFSLYNLSVSICNKNFAIQKSELAIVAKRDKIGYFGETLDELSQVDFSTVEILIIEHGINDYLGGVPVSNDEDKWDRDTFSGALRTSLKLLKETYPELRIILVTPTFCAVPDENGLFRDCNKYSYGGGYLEEYVEAELKVAKEMGVEVIDDYHLSGITADNFEEYLLDGLHLNEKGRKIIADLWIEYILGEEQ